MESSLDNDGDSILTDDLPSPTPTTPHHHDADADSGMIPAIPRGPMCSYGPRLAYTYFDNPTPRPETLNRTNSTDVDDPNLNLHWFTIDDQLLYLSFFQDSGPLNAACL